MELPVPFDADAVTSWAEQLDTTQLALVVEICSERLADLAAAGGDLDAIVDAAFRDGFDSRGVARNPQLVESIVVVFGSVRGRLGGSHTCRFGSIGDDWVWTRPEVIVDRMRHTDAGVRTVTLLPAVPGLEIDMVDSNARGGSHQRRCAERYRIGAEGVTLVDRRGAGPGRAHR